MFTEKEVEQIRDQTITIEELRFTSDLLFGIAFLQQ